MWEDFICTMKYYPDEEEETEQREYPNVEVSCGSEDFSDASSN